MDQSSHWHITGQGFAGAVLTAGLTLFGVLWQQNMQAERENHLRFLEGALTTAQETSRLLNDGHNELAKLVDASGDKGWKEISKSSWKDYWAFHQQWREQLIAEHFKLVRYFGKHMADQLIHIDEIDLHPIKDSGSSHPCEPVGGKNDLDIEKLSSMTECTIRIAAVEQDIVDQDFRDKKTGEIMDGIQEHWKLENSESQLLDDYDKSTVRYLRALDGILTQLGEPQVTILTSNSHT